MSDPISDMLTRINNALLRGKKEVLVPYSKFKHSLADLLARNNWIEKVETDKDGRGFRRLKLTLKYDEDGAPVIRGLKKISKPGQRIYAGSRDLPRVRFGVGSVVVSTSTGLMTDADARKNKVGGEVICQIW